MDETNAEPGAGADPAPTFHAQSEHARACCPDARVFREKGTVGHGTNGPTPALRCTHPSSQLVDSNREALTLLYDAGGERARARAVAIAQPERDRSADAYEEALWRRKRLRRGGLLMQYAPEPAADCVARFPKACATADSLPYRHCALPTHLARRRLGSLTTGQTGVCRDYGAPACA